MPYKWRTYPFPHLVIDNFLSDDNFLRLKLELQNINSFKSSYKSFNTSLESKQLYGLKSLGIESEKLVSIMGSSSIKNLISEFFDFNHEIISLGDTDDFSGYSPYHVTRPGGRLGSHLDHSYVGTDLIHVANTIFYASSEWQIDWGGETVFYSSHGFKACEFVQPIPNRLVVFIHTSESFHGVLPYCGPNTTQREIFYHDYYIPQSSIDHFTNSYFNKLRQKPLLLRHGTTFLPRTLLTLSLKTLSLSHLKTEINYLFGYLNYLLIRYRLDALAYFPKYFRKVLRNSVFFR